MSAPLLLISIDTEGDNVWARPAEIQTANARYLPRFQRLCEQFGFPPTYLVNYEMAIDPEFQRFGRTVLAEGTAEIGMHLHPWYSPPAAAAYDPGRPHFYAFELPEEALAAQIGGLTDILGDAFGARPVSHRAGKWGFDERVARILVRHGYLVDCSVTPGISWRGRKGDPLGRGGPDYRTCRSHPYFLDVDDVRSPGVSPLLEIPVTIHPNYGPLARSLSSRSRHIHALMRRCLGPSHTWLRPNGRNLPGMLRIVDRAVTEGDPVMLFALHSSELMPGGSPTFQSEAQVEALYIQLEVLFRRARRSGVTGTTLRGYRAMIEAPSDAPVEAARVGAGHGLRLPADGPVPVSPVPR